MKNIFWGKESIKISKIGSKISMNEINTKKPNVINVELSEL